MSTGSQPMYGWADVDWTKVERNVYKLQKRIFQAEQRGDVKHCHDQKTALDEDIKVVKVR